MVKKQKITRKMSNLWVKQNRKYLLHNTTVCIIAQEQLT